MDVLLPVYIRLQRFSELNLSNMQLCFAIYCYGGLTPPVVVNLFLTMEMQVQSSVGSALYDPVCDNSKNTIELIIFYPGVATLVPILLM